MNNNSLESAPSKFHIPSLDGLRAVAICIVFLSHAGLSKIIPGGLGVTIFFFLSGYLITTLLRLEHTKTGKIDIKKFYIRRMLRIWPNFYLVLFLGAILTILGILPGKVSFEGLLAQVLHLANYYGIFWGGAGTTIGTGVFWSLAVEEHFYLIFPLLYICLLKFKPEITQGQLLSIITTLCLIALLWRVYLVWLEHVMQHRTYYASDTRFDSLLFGCGLALFRNPVIDTNHQVSESLLKYVWLPLGIGMLVFSLIYRSDLFRETFRYTIQGIALIPIFIAAIRLPNWGLFRILNLKYVRFIGVLSYSFYLVHHTIIETLNDYFPEYSMLLLGLAAATLSLLFAYIIHRQVEVRLIQIRKKYSR